MYTVPATLPVKVVAGTTSPLQTTWFDGSFAVGTVLTVIANVTGVPVQALAEGVTVIVPEIFSLVVFVAVKAAISPVPLVAKPMFALEFVQEYVVPVTLNVLANVIAVVVSPAHKDCPFTAFTVGVGLIVIVYVIGDPAHPAVVGVTVIVAVIGAFVVFVAVKEGTEPDPLAANPIEGVLFVQAYVVEPNELVND